MAHGQLTLGPTCCPGGMEGGEGTWDGAARGDAAREASTNMASGGRTVLTINAGELSLCWR